MAKLTRHSSVRGRRGFSLIEVMIAVTILGVGLLAVAGAQIEAMRGGRYGKHSAQASRIAQSQLETLKRTRWDNIAPTGWTAPVLVQDQVDDPGGGTIEHTYNLQWRITDVVVDETRAIDVRVTWTEAEQANRQIVFSSLRFNHERL